MTLMQFISSLVPRTVYVPITYADVRINTDSGEMVLKREKSLGEEVLFKCYEEKTNLFRGFVVKNIKYGFFGDICNDVKNAIDSADQKWFEVMGLRRPQKQK